MFSFSGRFVKSFVLHQISRINLEFYIDKQMGREETGG